MGKWRPNGELIIAGQRIIVDAKIVNWTQSGWDATSKRCIPTETEPVPACKAGADGDVPYGNLPVPYTSRLALRPALRSYYANNRPPPMDAVKAIIKQFVIHHDGCSTSDMCWNVLQNERGLSCHFLIDNDGIIYQTCDLAMMAYHASEWNVASIGVELCNRGDAKKEPTYYSKHGINRPVKPCKINNNTILSYDFTKEQYDSMTDLARALQRLLPNLPAEYPQSSAGVASYDTMPYSSTFSYSGYIGHYHLTNQKWDPGPFDFKEFCRKLRGAFSYPIFPRESDIKPDTIPQIPSDPSALKEGTDLLYKANEMKADGGFFPVGPWGESRLWHGGVHLSSLEHAPVHAPFPGRLLAARMGPAATIGSTNFVLMRHEMTLASARVQFYSLYMHLDDATQPPPDKTPAPGWVGSKAWKDGFKAGQVVLLDEPIDAGAIIGRIGKAGPADLSRAQIHVEFFSTSELFTTMKGTPWVSIDGTAGGRFCEAPEINELIDTDQDGTLSRGELSSFYSSGSGAGTHYMVTYHVSEWTAEPAWADALRVPKDFKKWKPADIDQMVADQITPGLWWDAAVAKHCRLPPDGVVYHYHPVTFVQWFNDQQLQAQAQAGSSGTADANDAHEVPPGITDDYGDKLGTSMRSSSEVVEDPCNGKLTLQELVLGYDAPECGGP